MESKPASALSLSVVVIILEGRNCLVRCLKALAQQVGVPNLEILVPCDDHIQDIRILEGRFPSVRFLPIEGRRTYAELRAFGVREARGKIIALTEDQCIPNPDWCFEILKAHARHHAAVGGAIEKQIPDTALNWALYLADYGRYMNPMPEGSSNHLSDCNVAYKRSALDPISDIWCNEFHEPDVNGALIERGETLWFSPEIIVNQKRSIRVSNAIRDRYAFGRLLGSGRAVSSTTTRRAIYAVLALFLPLLLIVRVAINVFHKHRRVKEFLRSLPSLILLSTVWAFGEFMGYLTARPVSSLTPEHQASARPHSGQEATR